MPPTPPPPPVKMSVRKKQTFGPNVRIASNNFCPEKQEVRRLCVNKIVFDTNKLTKWIDNTILNDFIVKGSTSKFLDLEKYKKLAIPIIQRMGHLVSNEEIEIFKYSEFQEIMRKAILGESFSEAEDSSEDSLSDDDSEITECSSTN